MKLKSMVLAFLLGFSLVALLGAQEQQTGAIKGRVIDAEGAPLPGVAITLTGPSLLGSLSAISDREGEFRIAFVPPGSDYVLRAELGGFNTVIRKGLIIHLGMTISIEIEMSPAPVSEEIEVVAPSPVVDTVRSKTTQIVTTEALRRLPIARSTTAIIQLAPGTISQSVHGSGRGEAGFVFDGVQMV
ncbi:MAG: carboxypeptidase-like regulatory domain-containing protein [bacterium]